METFINNTPLTNLWEEKNSIEPKKNFVNKIELELTDFTKGIKTESEKNVCEDTGKKKQNYNKLWYLKNKDRISKQHKKYYQDNREDRIQSFRKNRLIHVFKKLSSVSNKHYKSGIITPFDLWKIAKRQKLRCSLTGEKLTRKTISLDHIIPKSKGGLNIPSNVRLVLYSVNIARQNLTDEEFIKLCEKVVNYKS